MMRLTYKHICLLVFVMFASSCANDPDIIYKEHVSAPVLTQARVKLPQKVISRTVRQAPPARQIISRKPAEYFDDSSDASTAHFLRYPEVQAFIDYMANKHGFSEAYLRNLFSNANRLESVIRLEMGSGHTTGPRKPHRGSWTRYRNKFLTEDHIRHGVEFWRANASTLRQASAAYGVDPEYIVGIIGVETYFGRNIGKTCVFDALTTLAFDTPRRSKFFKSELENFLLMAREEDYQPRDLVGSWAGAMGLGQFMPSSFRRLAIDFDHNGRRDLWQPRDAIGSVAHYFSRNGWRYNEPVTKQVDSPKGAAVIDLSTYEGDEYWKTYHNFKVIKRYNNSKKYAMAVHQLAQAIKERLRETVAAGG